jgi:putative pbsx phage terminase small subunit|nr:MAG TPA: hypothetical protein [Caudoviricetes sp.]
MSNEDIKLLIKTEYENGTSMSVLSKKYNIKLNTIKGWSYKEKWIKKKENTTTKRGTTSKKKKQPKKKVVFDKDFEIKEDIMRNLPKEQIIQKHSICERTYYKKRESVRMAMLERTEKMTDEIIADVYPNLKEMLMSMSKVKKNIIITTINKSKDGKANVKDLQALEKQFDIIKKMENELKKTGKLLTSYELLEIDKALTDEEMQLEKIEIEKAKNRDDIKDENISITIKGV